MKPKTFIGTAITLWIIGALLSLSFTALLVYVAVRVIKAAWGA